MCTIVVVLYNLDENDLNQKKLFLRKKNGQGIIYIFRFLDLPKVRKIKGYNFLRFFTWMLDFVYFLFEVWTWRLKFQFEVEI